MRSLVSISVLICAALPNLGAAAEVTSSAEISNTINTVSQLSSQVTSSINGVVDRVQCPNVKLNWDLGFNIPDLLSKINMGNCAVGANAKTLNCIGSSINALGHSQYTASPSYASKRSNSLFEKLAGVKGCSYSSPTIASSTTVVQAGYIPTSRIGERYRRCLNESSNCSVNAFKLPENIDAVDKDKNLAILLTTGSHERIYSGAFGQEQKVASLATDKCNTSSCIGNLVQKSYEDYTSDDGSVIKQLKESAKSESTLVEEASLGRYYFYDRSEEGRNLAPVQYRGEYLSGSYRASAIETFLNYHLYELSLAEKGLVEAQINKSKMASAPLLESGINQYITEVANAQ
ncbi:MAG: hypothetical protein PHV62_09665 [Sulfuricurvum sp.]|nr:hypothetical protein [Sulfuricurvum sp.]